MRAVLNRPVALEEVERSFVAAFSRVFEREVAPRQTFGPWLVAPAPQEQTADVERLVTDLSLHTVCQEAACPNIGECWGGGKDGTATATIMIMGDTCTRGCSFCAVKTSPTPAALGK